VLSITPLLAGFFTLVLLLLAARATTRLAVSRLSGPDRNRELGHAAMGFGMAVLLAPGLPRPPLVVSVTFFAALATWATFDWAQRGLARLRGRTVKSCAGTSSGGAHLLDPHHAIVSVAMVVMLLRPGMGTATVGPAMPGMAAMGTSPGTAALLLLAYVWIAALILGFGMTRVLASASASGETQTVLSSPATVYACELAMTVLTGLMLVT
jgi:hypothetical protein